MIDAESKVLHSWFRIAPSKTPYYPIALPRKGNGSLITCVILNHLGKRYNIVPPHRRNAFKLRSYMTLQWAAWQVER